MLRLSALLTRIPYHFLFCFKRGNIIQHQTRKVSVTGNVRLEACLKAAMAKIRKRAAVWGEAEGGKKGKMKKIG